MLGVRFGGQSFGDLFLICDIRTDLPGWARERRFYFDPPWNPGRQVLIHPCPGSTFRVDWQVPADFDEAPGARDARIRKIIGDRPYEVVWSSVYRFSSRVADRMRAGRVLLAGDLAHQLSPFGARGLNSGVQDAENAAWKIAFVLRGWAPDALLDSYHSERHAAACENLEVTTATMRFLVPATGAERRHRVATLEAAVADPAARSAVDSGRLAEPFWYSASPLTTPDPARPFAGRPARGAVPPPGPGILVPDVPVAAAQRPAPGTLRALAREGFLLLCAAGADVAAAQRAAAAVAAPVRVLDAAALPDSGAALAEAGLAAPGEVWVIRPDAHAAAVLRGAGQAAIAAALRRALALPARGGDPPEPPAGLRPGSSVTGPGPCQPGGDDPRNPPLAYGPGSSVTGPGPASPEGTTPPAPSSRGLGRDLARPAAGDRVRAGESAVRNLLRAARRGSAGRRRHRGPGARRRRRGRRPAAPAARPVRRARRSTGSSRRARRPGGRRGSGSPSG